MRSRVPAMRFAAKFGDENGVDETWRKIGGSVTGDWLDVETRQIGSARMAFFASI